MKIGRLATDMARDEFKLLVLTYMISIGMLRFLCWVATAGAAILSPLVFNRRVFSSFGIGFYAAVLTIMAMSILLILYGVLGGMQQMKAQQRRILKALSPGGHERRQEILQATTRHALDATEQVVKAIKQITEEGWVFVCLSFRWLDLLPGRTTLIAEFVDISSVDAASCPEIRAKGLIVGDPRLRPEERELIRKYAQGFATLWFSCLIAFVAIAGGGIAYAFKDRSPIGTGIGIGLAVLLLVPLVAIPFVTATCFLPMKSHEKRVIERLQYGYLEFQEERSPFSVVRLGL